MLFKECKFHSKYNVLKVWQKEIFNEIKDELPETVFINDVNRYISYLLEDTDYDPKNNNFYEPVSKFNYTVKFFSQITLDYITSHLEEFTGGL